MKLVGMMTTVIGAVLAAIAVIVGIRSVPDVKRYLKMRQM
ncbi:hypothetical protein BH18ACT9_BH18ACT9_21310 [soil metagenome]